MSQNDNDRCGDVNAIEQFIEASLVPRPLLRPARLLPLPHQGTDFLRGSVVHVLDATGDPRIAQASNKKVADAEEFCCYRVGDRLAWVPPEIDDHFWFARLAHMCQMENGWHVKAGPKVLQSRVHDLAVANEAKTSPQSDGQNQLVDHQTNPNHVNALGEPSASPPSG
jgi:hypothetical protein